VHRPRRVVRREVERLEVVPVVLDLRAVGQLVAQSAEDFGDPFQGARNRMDAAALRLPARQGDVDRLAGQARVERDLVQQRLARGQRRAHRVAGAVDRLAHRLALLGRQRPQLLELGGDAALLAEQGHAQRVQRLGILRCRDVGERARRQGFDVAHGFFRPLEKLGILEKTMGKDSRPSPRFGRRAARYLVYGGETALRPPGRPWPSRPAP